MQLGMVLVVRGPPFALSHFRKGVTESATKQDKNSNEYRCVWPWIVILCIPMVTTDPRLDGLSLKGNEPPQGGKVSLYPKVLGIHNSWGSASYDRTRANLASPG
ncbi:hypothetical protein PIB30_029568 [Stylosanthes scabra]|uniref:Uncharacterized protein n=1 Tax=Stylosanthes scabra TaxID=79078 RepID=A0ABU6X9P0_9FABA|nr:hypothetical protein [Stylosanthes scabra]